PARAFRHTSSASISVPPRLSESRMCSTFMASETSVCDFALSFLHKPEHVLMIIPTARTEIDFAQVAGCTRLCAKPSGRGQRDAVAGRFRVIEITVTVLPVRGDERRDARVG